MKNLGDLIRILKSYPAGLSLDEAVQKLYREEGVLLAHIIKNLDESSETNISTLGILIEVLEKRDPEEKFNAAGDAFAADLNAKTYPMQIL